MPNKKGLEEEIMVYVVIALVIGYFVLSWVFGKIKGAGLL